MCKDFTGVSIGYSILQLAFIYDNIPGTGFIKPV
jgi:hypothetical protein